MIPTNNAGELFTIENQAHLSVSDGLELLWRGHLDTKPSGSTYKGNRIALQKSFGALPICELNEIHVSQHMEARLKGLKNFVRVGAQTVRHDLQLLVLMLNTLKRWKRKRLIFQGVHFANVELPEENPLADIRRPKAQRREVIVRPLEFSRVIERATPKMADRLFFSIDTGMNECDLRALKVSDCDLNENCIRFVRRKNRHKVSTVQVLPLTNRCRGIILNAVKEGREFVLDWTNHINEWRKLRYLLAIRYQWRDFRKTFGNAIYQRTKQIAKAQKALGHASPRTTIDHYIVDDGGDLKNPVRHVADTFHGGRTE